ncbi:hypothetical protein [Shimia abyssi]|nr:hypothetical protein [Shimia abyssi]
MKQNLVYATCFALGLSSGAKADPAFGVGLTYIFGGDVAFGVRVFSDDRPEQGALALGLDYKFLAKSWRPNVGAAYLDEDFYADFSVGLDLTTQELDFGIGAGAALNVQNVPSSGGPTPGATDPSGPL